MKNEANEILDDLLSRWHSHCCGFSLTEVIAVDPMFRGEICRSGWDSSDDILDAQLNRKKMKAIDFQVSEMAEPYKSAIHVAARNACTGVKQWNSPRLPTDHVARCLIVAQARRELTERLIKAGVM